MAAMGTILSPDLFQRVRRILLTPKEEWQAIATEEVEPRSLWLGYVAPLAAIGPVAAILGGLVFGYRPFMMLTGYGMGFVIRTALVTYIGALIAVGVIAWMVKWLAPRFGGQCEGSDGLKIAAYSGTAAWVAGVFGLVPLLAPLSIVGLYSLYLLYLGLQTVAGVPKERTLAFEVTLILAAVIIVAVLSLVTPLGF